MGFGCCFQKVKNKRPLWGRFVLIKQTCTGKSVECQSSFIGSENTAEPFGEAAGCPPGHLLVFWYDYVVWAIRCTNPKQPAVGKSITKHCNFLADRDRQVCGELMVVSLYTDFPQRSSAINIKDR